MEEWEEQNLRVREVAHMSTQWPTNLKHGASCTARQGRNDHGSERYNSFQFQIFFFLIWTQVTKKINYHIFIRFIYLIFMSDVTPHQFFFLFTDINTC